MKHNMNRVLSIVALLMLTIGAWADAERVNITTTGGGELKYNISGTTCTLTATPASGYYLTVENLTAVKVISGSVVQAPARRSIEIDENVTITATNASADPSGVTTYTFTMPTDENISVNVTAEFQTRTSITGAIITLATTSFTYDGTAKEPAVSSVVLSGTTLNAADYEVSYSDNVDAGTNATVTVTGKRTYTGTASTTFTIEIASFTPTVTLAGWTFGETANTPSVRDNVSEGEVSFTYATKGSTEFSSTVPTNAGEYTVKATIAAKGNYSAAEATADFTISKASFMPTVTLAGWTFGETANTPSVRDNVSEGEVSFTYATKGSTEFSSTVPTNAGEYTVKATIAAKGNYSAAEATADFTISKASFMPTVTLAGWTFGETANTPSVQDNVSEGNVTFTYATKGSTEFSSTVPTDAGEYTVKATIAAKGNYAAAEATADFTISKASFMPTVTLAGWTFGETANTPSVQDNVSEGNVTFTYATKGSTEFSSTVPTDAGEYTVKATIAAKGNYAAAEATADFTISKASFTPTVTLAGWTFGETANTPSVQDNVSEGEVSFTYATKGSTEFSSTVPTNAGEYTVKATIAAKGNYTAAEATADFTISKASFTPTVTLAGWTFGETANTPSVQDNVSEGEVSFTYATKGSTEFSSTVPTNAGEYTVKATIAAKGNYAAAEATADFTISKASFTPTVTLAGWTFGETANTPSVQDNVSEGEVSFTYATKGSTEFSSTVPTNAGEYTVKATIAAKGNYAAAEATADFTISKASFTPTVTLAGWTFGETANTPSVQDNVSEGEVSFTYATKGSTEFSSTVPTNAGEYTVKATIAAKGNYAAAEATADFTISKASFTPTVTLAGWTFGETANTPSVRDNVSEGEVSFTYATKGSTEFSSTVPTDAGEYTVKATIAAKGNYTAAEATADFTISKAYLTVEGVRELTVSITGWKYGAEHAGPTVSGNLGNADVTYTYKDGKDDQAEFSVTVPTTVGSYIVKATVAESDNYFGGEAYNEFSIEKGDIPTPTVSTIDGQTYDGQAHNIITVSGVPTGTTVKYYYAGITASDYSNESFELLCEPGEDEFSATVPTTTDAGYFALLYRIDGGDNYNDIEAGRLIKVAFVPASISEVTIDKTSMEYTGEAQTVTITSVKAGTMNLTANDYTVSYEMVDEDEEPVQVDAPVETGTYNVVVTGKGNFTGTKSATFTIVNRTLADGEVTFHEGWATYCSLIGDVNLPAGIGAYVASGLGNGVVTLTQISYIPAKEPVLLNNATTTTTDNTEYPFNLLQYAGEDIDVDDMYYYGLHNGAFMRVTGTIPEGKIYLYAEEPNAPQLTIVIDGETTGINEIETMRNVDNENVYDLMGRKVQKPSKKGLYISNGHKVVVNK